MLSQYNVVGPDDEVGGGLEPTPYDLACQAYYEQQELERQIKRYAEVALRDGLSAKTCSRSDCRFMQARHNHQLLASPQRRGATCDATRVAALCKARSGPPWILDYSLINRVDRDGRR